ncbi:DAK2 domain-containing protein [Georgenia yuyongxinii]|uniref:DAK2 domain-containing protein n=1 Tax=Georgenia yuyongxinii TaxID=2589797 RepID=A0A552WRS3_9MICO|nr:DAK2 domain-containing protein [Georgenia yuyongxinii]TRW45472.1 DAK2 domain-containing protein [Georgenia yuyongxinii]
MPTPLAVLDAAAVRAWFEHALRSLLLVRHSVDRLNVFPVPDADTGTNMVLTLAGAAEAVRELPADAELATLTRTAADGALLGARGNSGVILGQCLQALAEAFTGADTAGADVVARALDGAARQARAAVGHPVEGTVLTVARAAADGATKAADAALGTANGELLGTVEASLGAARNALAATRGAHGVAVDAGAAGYVVLLGALRDVVAGEADSGARRATAALLADIDGGGTSPAVPGLTITAGPVPSALPSGTPGPTDPADHDDAAGDFEVMYVLRADAARAATLRAELVRTAHSVAVVGWSDETGAGLWQVHVHTDAPLAALAEPALVEQVCVRYLRPLLTDPHPPGERGPDHVEPVTRPRLSGTGVVACTKAPGLVEPLARTGAVVVLSPGEDPAGILRAAADTGASEVLVLPCDDAVAATVQAAATAAAAGRGAPHLGRQVLRGAGTRSDVQVLAAAVEIGLGAGRQGHPPAALAEQAVRRTRTAEVDDVDGTLASAVAALVAPSDELVTALLGADADDDVAELVRELVAQAAPEAEVVIVRGGQAAPTLQLGVE